MVDLSDYKTVRGYVPNCLIAAKFPGLAATLKGKHRPAIVARRYRKDLRWLADVVSVAIHAYGETVARQSESRHAVQIKDLTFL